MTKNIQPGGEFPLSPQEYKKPLSPLEMKFKEIEKKFQEFQKAVDPKYGIPMNKVCTAFEIYNDLMKLEDSQVIRVDELVLENLNLMPDLKNKGQRLNDQQKAHLFSKLYHIDRQLAYDGVAGIDKITDNVGAEATPLAVRLHNELQTEGWTMREIREGIKYAAVLYPIVKLASYAQADSGKPAHNLELIAQGDAEQFLRDFKHNFPNSDIDKEKWLPFFRETILVIWNTPPSLT